MSGNTTNRGLPYPVGSDVESAFPALAQSLAQALDFDMSLTSGLFSARPSPGVVGRWYLATDGVISGRPEGDAYLDTGNAWAGPMNHSGSPLGSLKDYAGASDPPDPGWLIANGRAVSRSTYAALFALIGTTYGSGNGSTTFNLPDTRQRVTLGVAASGTGSTLGGTGGAIDHTHTSATHSHSLTTGAASINVDSGSGAIWGGTNSAIQFGTSWKVSGLSISNLGTNVYGLALLGSSDVTTPAPTGQANPPFIALNKIIRVL